MDARLTIVCPACGRKARTHAGAWVAFCQCGAKIDRSEFATRTIHETQSTTAAYNPRRPNHWLPLHRYPVRNAARWDAAVARERLSQWIAGIPTFGCRCQSDFLQLLKTYPPDFSSPVAMEMWAWRVHNAIRTKLGQQKVAWEDARRIARQPVVGFTAAAYQQIGGTETFHRTLLPALHRDGKLWVDGFVVTSEQWAEGDPALLGVPWFGIGINAARILAARVDVLVTWGIDNLETILPTPRPKVIGVHHSDLDSDWSHGTITKNAPLIDHTVAVHPDITSDLLGTPVTFIPNAVDSARCSGGDATGLRERWRIPADDHIHFWCHRMSPEKQPRLALDIAKHFPPGHTLVMAGRGALYQEIQQEASTIPNVRVVGKIDSPVDWLQTTSTFLALATFEGFGLSVAEAMGAGVPVVSTPTGIAAKPGLATLVPADAPASQWAEAIVGQAGERANYASEHIRSQHAPEPWAQRWTDVILETVGDTWRTATEDISCPASVAA